MVEHKVRNSPGSHVRIARKESEKRSLGSGMDTIPHGRRRRVQVGNPKNKEKETLLGKRPSVLVSLSLHFRGQHLVHSGYCINIW